MEFESHILFIFREFCKLYYGKRRYGDDRYKCATGDVEKGVVLEGLADGYRGTEQLKGY